MNTDEGQSPKQLGFITNLMNLNLALKITLFLNYHNNYMSCSQQRFIPPKPNTNASLFLRGLLVSFLVFSNNVYAVNTYRLLILTYGS